MIQCPPLTIVSPKVSSVEEESEPEYHQLFEYAFVVGLKEGKDRKGRGRGGGRKERREREHEKEEEGEGRGGRVSMRGREEEV